MELGRHYCKACNKVHHEEHHKNQSVKRYQDVKLSADDYIIVNQIGAGSFGEVYRAKNKNNRYVAAKIEDRRKAQRVYMEYKIYSYLQKHSFAGLPRVYDYVQTSDYNMMFMQLLGPTLDELFVKYHRKFNLSTVFMIAEQTITLLKHVHCAEYIHRDIKPNNFLIGTDHLKKQIYIADFGLSKKYINTGKHIPFKDKRSLIGTARYASINMHMGFEPSRRDDLEAIGYMLIYFLKGSLPWQGIKGKKINNSKKQLEAIGEVKMCTSLDTLCYGLPGCFKEFLKYCKSLKFDETVDYQYILNLFKTDAIALKIVPKFQWLSA